MRKKMKDLQQQDMERGAYLKVGKKWKRLLMVNLENYTARTDNNYPPTIYVCEPDTEIIVKGV